MGDGSERRDGTSDGRSEERATHMTETKSGEPSRRERLSHAVTEELQRQIASGALSPGDQLPTELQLVSQFGVSRTVIREAISGLRANGLVEARQGLGVFVTGTKTRMDMSILSGDLASLASVLELLELRAPLEIEAAGLAAMRRTASQELAIRVAFDNLTNKIARGESSAGGDFDLHMAIVEATNNRFYVDVLKFLGQKTIPRSQLTAGPTVYAKDYLDLVHAEHSRIVGAISEQNAELAREEMRRHLMGSQRRYRSLLTQSADPPERN